MQEKRKRVLQVLQVAAMAVLAWPVLAHAGVPYPDATTPKAIDLGPLSAQSGTTPISVTIALSLPNLNDAETLLKSLNDPQDPQYHQFLTADQFVARFAPSDSDVATVVASLAKFGLTAERTTATTLRVTGLPADMERAFAVSLHSYSTSAHGNVPGYTFHAPLSRATVPAEISAAVAAVVGLDNRPTLRPHNRVAPYMQARPSAPATTGDAFGYLTVTDFAKHYDVQPLYKRGVSGSGRTLGIVTFASFTPSDAYAYWKAVGLSVHPNRIHIVDIDGGPGAPSDAAGSDETTLDVEQSGGIAPGAKIIVYQGPNTNQSEIDVFASAIDANVVETLSTSWGFWEWLDNLENSPVTDPVTGRTVGITQALHELLVRAAIQGQTVFAAAGDGGAYDANDSLGCYGPYSPSQPNSTCSLALSVDYPASDTAITAAGGTTLAGVQENCLNAACTAPFYRVDVPHERVWGWDYLEGYYKVAFGCDTPIACGIFSAGGGGGVSTLFKAPWYQVGLPGIQLSQPDQIFKAGEDFIAADGIVELYYPLPSHYPGRNVPDVSFNADPYTGYVVYYTSSATGFGIEGGWGGTSFVGPQLNGVSALLGEYLHGRIGLLNYALYAVAHSDRAYRGPTPPLHAIAYGDNWFYHGSNGYNPAAGLGTIDVANFTEFLHGLF
jgi:subtilase family serine protease